MSPNAASPDGLLGNFAQVDRTNAADFVERLDTMHMLDFFRAYKQETFGLMGLGPGAEVADVGCGTGEDAQALAEFVGQGGASTGFDVSESILDEARKRHGTGRDNLRFIRGAADALPVPDGSFDALRADRVLTHVTNVPAAMREMARVLKPGGRLVISEPDMRGCWVTSNNHTITDRVMYAIATSCKQPSIGRELYHHFLDAGLADVRLTLRSVAISDPVAVEKILKFGLAMNALVEAGELTTEEVALWQAEFEERQRLNRFLAGVTMFIVDGKKPK